MGRWEIKDGLIQDSKKKKQAQYLALSYKWIQKWFMDCVKKVKEQSKQMKHKEGKAYGEMGLNKVIFGVEQYLEAFPIPQEELNPILEVSLHHPKKALEFYTKQENLSGEDKLLYQELEEVWSEFQERIVREFFEKLKKYFDENSIHLVDKKKV